MNSRIFLEQLWAFNFPRRLFYIKLVSYWLILDPPDFSYIMSFSSTSTDCSSLALLVTSCGYFAYWVLKAPHWAYQTHINCGFFSSFRCWSFLCTPYTYWFLLWIFWDKGCVVPLCLHLSVVLLSVKKKVWFCEFLIAINFFPFIMWPASILPW